MMSISSVEKDSIVIIFECKIGNQIHAKFKEREVPQGARRCDAQKWLFCRTCKIYMFHDLLPKLLKNASERVHS